MRKALGCIAPSVPKATSTYTQALLAYTFALAKDSQRTQKLLDMLDRKAIRAGMGTSVPGEHQRRDERPFWALSYMQPGRTMVLTL